jgi:hypothetical protein
MGHCASCGKKIGKRRLEGSGYAGFFCSQACHLQYGDNLIGMLRTSEVEAEQEMEKAGFFNEIVDDLDAAASVAAKRAHTPQEIATQFLGTVAGKFATKVYSKIEEAAKGWADRRARAQAEAAEAAEAEERRKAEEAVAAEQAAAKEREKQAAKAKPQETPEQADDKEPENLDSLSLKEQRYWLVHRFKKLRGREDDATPDDVRAEWARLIRQHHPDRGGSVDKVAVLNATYTRIKEIDEKLQKRKKAKR